MLVFDIETDNLLYDVTKVHCMTIYDTIENKFSQFRPLEVARGVNLLQGAINNDIPISGHNIINYDIPVLEKLYGLKVPREKRGNVVDTLVLSRLMFGDIKDKDMALYRQGVMPGYLVGSHSLKAWGYRLGVLKGTYAAEHKDAWKTFNDDMLKYNEQDVVVTNALFKYEWKYFGEHGYTHESLILEHKAEWLMSKQERNGFTFDVPKALELEKILRARQAILTSKLLSIVPQIPDKLFVPKRDNKHLGYKAGVPIQRYKDFNPNSRQQIEWLIEEHFKYKPASPDLWDTVDKQIKRRGLKISSVKDTKAISSLKDRLKIDDVTFSYIKTDKSASKELRDLASVMEESLLIGKRLGQLIDGKYGWLKVVKSDGKIHGSVNPCGTVTGRATHSYPNVAQVPAVNSPYGKECRSLFKCPKGWYEVGADACGLELRCLAHFMHPYDNGAYAHEILTGDIHTANQKAAGLAERSQAKVFIYAYLYGAGDERIGKIVGGTSKDGKRLKAKFLEHTPALTQLRESIESTLVLSERYVNGKPIIEWKRRYLKGLDKRPLHVRSLHSSLNLLLQSAGALICKYWTVTLEERLVALGLDHGKDFQFMAWIHDEVQVACRTKEIAEVVLKEAQSAMRDSQEHFGFRVQLDTDGKIGENWCDCH